MAIATGEPAVRWLYVRGEWAGSKRLGQVGVTNLAHSRILAERRFVASHTPLRQRCNRQANTNSLLLALAGYHFNTGTGLNGCLGNQPNSSCTNRLWNPALGKRF